MDECARAVYSNWYLTKPKGINLQEWHNVTLLNSLNSSRGFGMPLGEKETKYFLTLGKLNIHLGTADEKGDANIHPAWY